jgi:hypothetical protein
VTLGDDFGAAVGVLELLLDRFDELKSKRKRGRDVI